MSTRRSTQCGGPSCLRFGHLNITMGCANWALRSTGKRTRGHTIDDDVLVTIRPISSIKSLGIHHKRWKPIQPPYYREHNGRIWPQAHSGDLTHPLLNRNLLGMQQHLNRVVALSGVSEAAGLEDDTDEEAEGPMAWPKSAFIEHWVSPLGPYRISPQC